MRECAASIIAYSISTSDELLKLYFFNLTKRIESFNLVFSSLQQLDEIIIDNNIKFIVVDSIAAIVRKEFNATHIRNRQAVLGKQAARLKLLAENYNIPVLVTNQVTTTRNAPTAFNFTTRTHFLIFLFEITNFRVATAGSNVKNTIAALGTAWAHCVNTRLILHSSQNKSMITIAKSPISAVYSFPYIITGIDYFFFIIMYIDD